MSARVIRNWGLIGIVAVGAVVSLGVFLTKSTDGEVLSKSKPAHSAPAHSALSEETNNSSKPRVLVIKPKTQNPGETLEEPGSIEAFEYAELYAKVSGYLAEQKLDIGDMVLAGQTVAKLKVPEFEQALIQAEAEIVQAKAHVEQVEAAVKTAEANKDAADAVVVQNIADLESAKSITRLRQLQSDRMKKLSAANAVDAELVDEKQEALDSAQAHESVAKAAIVTAKAQVTAAIAKIAQAVADLANAKAQVHVAEAVRDKAKVFVAYTTIKSPYTGVITHRGFHVGDFIRAADQGGAFPLFRVVRTDKMRVVVKIPDTEATFADVGDPVKLWSVPLHKEFRGTITRIANSEDQQRMMRVEIDLKNPTSAKYPAGELRDGSYVKATLLLARASKGMTLPSVSVISDPLQKGSFVYVVRDGHARRVPVDVGPDNGVEVQIFSGIRPNDWVVRRPGDELSDGIAVDMEQSPGADGKAGSSAG